LRKNKTAVNLKSRFMRKEE